jgi:murein DD-endopeptidase MepM/ murein hydrolase activator NlpD
MRWLLLTLTSLLLTSFFSTWPPQIGQAQKLKQTKAKGVEQVQQEPKVIYVEKKIYVSEHADTVVIPTGNPVPPGTLKRKLNQLSGFGYRTHPIFKTKKLHTGIDIGCKTGTPVLSTADGKIVRVEYKKGGYGRNLVVEHKDGYRTLYAHLSQFSVKVGELVSQGQVIGYSGSTGTSTSPHLHYEVIRGNRKVDPKTYMINE